MVTKHFDRYGIEIKIDSVQEDQTQSWLSAGCVDKYVTELAVDHTKPTHFDEAPSSTGKFVAIKPGTKQLTAPWSSRN